MYVLQLEKSPTLGSIDTTDFDKRQLAYRSLDFNLNSNVFCELFPEIVEKIQVSDFSYVKFPNCKV